MKRTIKKILASLLVTVMILTAVPMSGIADIDWGSLFAVKASAKVTPASGSCGTNVTYTFDSGTGLLTISGTGDMYDYHYVEEAPFSFNTLIKSVVIENGVTSIGDCSFYECNNLTSAIIPTSVTSIRGTAFLGCTGLTSITIPDSVTIIGNYAFSGCQSLTDIIIPDSVTTIGEQAFWGCTGLTSVTIPDSVTRIGIDAFKNCTNLSEIDYYGTQLKWDVITGLNSVCPEQTVIHLCEHGQCGENVYWTLDKSTGLLTISGTGDMYDYDWTEIPFYDNQSIKSVVIDSGVTSISDYMFNYCRNLINITLPDSIISIGENTFTNCESLEKIEISTDNPVFDSRDNCNAIIETNSNTLLVGCKSSIIPDNIISIGNFAFAGCYVLTNITIPDSIKNIGACAFADCKSLTTVNISDIASWCNIEFEDSSSNPTYYAHNLLLNGELVTDLIIPDSVTNIGDYAFINCCITSVIIPDGVTSIGYAAFDNCSDLTRVTIPSSIKYIGDWAFGDCRNLSDVYYQDSIIQWNLINNGFVFCDPMIHFCLKEHGQCGENVFWTFDESTGLLTINGTGDMYDYSNISIPEEIPFYNKDSIKTVIIDDGVTNIGFGTFGCCGNLTSVTIPDSVKSIGDYAFWGCKGLTSITIPDSVTSIESSAFSACISLTSIAIPDSVTSIDEQAFGYCSSLTSITIPASVEKIGSKAIANCDNLQTVIFESDEYIDMDSSVFLNSPNVTILCKENSYMHYYADMEGLKYCIIDGSNNPNFTVKNDILISYNGEAENVFLSSASKIGFEAFKGNTDIKSVELANNVTRIYNSAFKNCTGLEKIIIPKSVASIGDSAFTGCDSLTIWCYAGSYAEVYAVNHDIPLEYITLNLSDNSITVADSEEITLDASFSTSMVDSGEIIWASSNPEIATVENGRVNVVDFGEAEITATTANGLSASCEIKVDLKLDSAADAVIDNESGIVFGSDMVNKDADGIKNLFINSRISVTNTDGAVGTGDKVSLLKADGTVYREIDIVIFGDVNGDGWYDGTDSVIVNCLANGILSREQVGEAVYAAADCNHDDVIDENDVALLEQAGLILAGVDQSKTAAELFEDAAFCEYISLINQNPMSETPAEEMSSDVTPTDKPVDEGFNKSFIQRIIDFIIYIVNLMKSFIAKF